jgi:hypothetical protein
MCCCRHFKLVPFIWLFAWSLLRDTNGIERHQLNKYIEQNDCLHGQKGGPKNEKSIKAQAVPWEINNGYRPRVT